VVGNSGLWKTVNNEELVTRIRNIQQVTQKSVYITTEKRKDTGFNQSCHCIRIWPN
jgi:hypothetical protein